jgi:cysteine desulfurase
VHYIDVNAIGEIQAESVTQILNAHCERDLLFIVGLVNSEIGTIQNVDTILKLTRAANVRLSLHVDAVHAFPYLETALRKLSPDTISISSHKLGALKGAGVLVHKRDVKLSSLHLGGGQERGKRAGTENLLSIISFVDALQEIEMVKEEEMKRVRAIRDYAWRTLKEFGFELNGAEVDSQRRSFNNLNIHYPGIESELLLVALDQKNIEISTGSACSTGVSQKSHVIEALALSTDRAKHSLRLTFGYRNTIEEIDQLNTALHDILKSSISPF